MQQVLLNLLLNAADAMRTVAVANRVVTIATARDGDRVVLTVSDRGTGIPPPDLERIFDPFWSTKASGVGVGLAICQAIVNAHQGMLTVANLPGRGAIFRVLLPVQGRG